MSSIITRSLSQSQSPLPNATSRAAVPKRSKVREVIKSKAHPPLKVQTNTTRFGFSIPKDIALLKEAISQNPWQLGAEKWEFVASELSNQLENTLTERTVKERIARLIKNYSTQQLATKSGTEEEISERGLLIETVISIIEEEKARINKTLGAEDLLDPDDYFNLSEVEEVIQNEPVTQKKRKLKDTEKEAAETERENAFITYVKDLAPTPSGSRKKRVKLSAEDELIKAKQDHEMDMDVRRIGLEEERQKKEMELEEKRLELELVRLEIEKSRESRLEAENKRKDDFAVSQLQFQNLLLELLSKK